MCSIWILLTFSYPCKHAGCGKKAVAGILAAALFEMGRVTTSELFVLSMAELKYLDLHRRRPSYVYNAKLKGAAGGVVYIDGLHSGSVERCSKLLRETIGDVLIVSGGGHDAPTLGFRRENIVEFPDLNALVRSVRTFALREDFVCFPGLEMVAAVCKTAIGCWKWGKRDDVKKLWEQIKLCRERRVHGCPELVKTGKRDDVRNAFFDIFDGLARRRTSKGAPEQKVAFIMAMFGVGTSLAQYYLKRHDYDLGRTLVFCQSHVQRRN